MSDVTPEELRALRDLAMSRGNFVYNPLVPAPLDGYFVTYTSGGSDEVTMPLKDIDMPIINAYYLKWRDRLMQDPPFSARLFLVHEVKDNTVTLRIRAHEPNFMDALHAAIQDGPEYPLIDARTRLTIPLWETQYADILQAAKDTLAAEHNLRSLLAKEGFTF